MPRFLVLLLALLALSSCNSIQTSRPMNLTGAAAAATVDVRVVDPRTGAGYAGTLPADGTTSEAIGYTPTPAIVLPTSSGVTVDIVTVKKKP